MHDILVVTYNRDKKILKATVHDKKGAFILVNRFKEEEAEKLWKILNGESQKKNEFD